MSNTIQLVGAETVTSAANQMLQAAHEMSRAAASIADTMYQRRIWEEEYLQRIEAIVREELDFYKPPTRVDVEGRVLVDYRLPDGSVVAVDDSAAKGASTIDYALKGGAIVTATRLAAHAEPR